VFHHEQSHLAVDDADPAGFELFALDFPDFVGVREEDDVA
jgi:hypothetical protein